MAFSIKHILILLVLVLFSANVSAIGIGATKPFEFPMLFEPGKEFDIHFQVTGYDNEPEIFVEGDLRDYVVLSEVSGIETGTARFSAHVKLPQEIAEPGIHAFYVGANDKLLPGQGMGGIARIRKAYLVIVLFESKEIEAQIAAPNMNVDERSDMIVEVTSWTKQKIDEVYAEIAIVDAQNNPVKTIYTQKSALESGKKLSLAAMLDSTGLKPGSYEAKAKIFYDGQYKEVSDAFNLGTLTVKLGDYTRIFSESTVNPLVISVESGWNNRIDDVYAEGYVDGVRIFKTTTEDLLPWDSKELSSFWDTANYPPGNYTVLLKVFYSGGQQSFDLNYEVMQKEDYLAATGKAQVKVEKPSALSSRVMILMSITVALLVLAVVNILWMIKQKKR